MPSGGRRRTTWTKATRPKGGRKKGSKDRVPRSWTGSLRQIYHDVASDNPDLIYKAVVRGLKAPAPKSFAYLNLMTAYIDGKPTEAVSADEVRRLLRQINGIVISLLPDALLRRRWVTEVNALTGIVDAPVAIDAPPTDAEPPTR